MNNRKVWFAVCYAVAAFFHFYYNPAHGRPEDWPLLFVPFVLGWVAFLLPAILPVVLIEEGAFHYAAWDEHSMTTMLCATLLACLIWFFPPRVARWFGTFDPVGDAGKRRLPSPVRGAAHALDFLNKRLFGRQKTGGWA